MDKIKRTIIGLYRLITLGATAYVAWKIVRYWQKRISEKNGRAVERSLNAAAEKLAKAAIALEDGADGGLGEIPGQSRDEVLADTRKALEKATDLFTRALHRARYKV